MRAGATASRCRGTTSVSGRANDSVTAAKASSEVIPPTWTPEMVTPLAIAAGAVVVVVPVVVAATTPADRPPAAASPSTNSTSSPTFLIPLEILVIEDARIVRDHAVDAQLVEPGQQRGVVDGPDEHPHAQGVAARHPGLAEPPPVQDGRGRVRAGQHRGDAPWQRAPEAADDRPRRWLEGAPLGQAGAVLRVRPPEPQPRLDRVQRAQRVGAERADERPLDEAVPPQRLGDRPFGVLSLEVEMHAGRGRRQQGEDVVERRQAVGGGRTVVRDDQLIADQVHVELDEVAAELDRERDPLERVLRRERARAAMANLQRPAFTPRELDHVRLRTTTAQSSVRSPPKARQSSTTACAS